ncbi:MAG: stage IV sporulation protein A [Oscillospiraceae bacterium]
MDEARHLYDQIAKRTAGSIYIGVVGPVRTGKSTFIKRFMEQLVLPHLENTYQRDRARDELPQSGSGRTIMTTEPKFVPEQAVEISPDGVSKLKVRLIDSVGYLVPGAMGADEEGTPRMVMTPWAPEEIPLAQAAEIGTKKVMEEHSSIGIVMTTDGSITDIPAGDYEQAQSRAISDMLATGKPFVILVNSEHPESAEAKNQARRLSQQYGVGARAVNALTMDEEQIQSILTDLMYEFPATELRFFLPGWVRVLPDDSPVKIALYDAMREQAGKLTKIAQAEPAMKELLKLAQVQSFAVTDVDLGTGTITAELSVPESLFYELLSQKTGLEIAGELDLMQILTELAAEQQEYARVKSAMEQVRATGYGIVMPDPSELHLDKPEIVRKGSSYAVHLKASAPSIHLMRANIETELSPIVGDEQQSDELIKYLLGEYEGDTEKLWQSNIFGKSLYDLVTEGLNTKIQRMPEDARQKLTRTLARMINENTGGMICILL